MTRLGKGFGSTQEQPPHCHITGTDEEHAKGEEHLGQLHVLETAQAKSGINRASTATQGGYDQGQQKAAVRSITASPI